MTRWSPCRARCASTAGLIGRSRNDIHLLCESFNTAHVYSTINEVRMCVESDTDRAQVVRCFEDDDVVHVAGKINPVEVAHSRL